MPFDHVNFVLPAVETDLALRVLTEARALIQLPENWCKVHFDNGNHAHCILGALDCAGHSWIGRTYLLDALPAGADRSVIIFNDNPATTHADVLALFDRAIAARRKELDHA